MPLQSRFPTNHRPIWQLVIIVLRSNHKNAKNESYYLIGRNRMEYLLTTYPSYPLKRYVIRIELVPPSAGIPRASVPNQNGVAGEGGSTEGLSRIKL